MSFCITAVSENSEKELTDGLQDA